MKLNLLIGVVCLTLGDCKIYAQNISNSKTEIKTNKMKEFSFLVRVPISYSREQANAVNQKWNLLLDRWKADSIYIISFAFPGEGYVVAGKDKPAKKETVISDNLRVVSNIFLRAENIEGAVELAKSFPILEYGGNVEVREIPPRPGN